LEATPAADEPDVHDQLGLARAVRNTSKRIVRVPPGADNEQEATRLVESADILFVSGAGEVLGGPTEDMLERSPGLVVLAVSDFGRSGPYADFEATSAVMAGLGWMLFRAGTPELPPVLPPGWIPYDIASIAAAFAALTGLHHRRKTGAGQFIEVSVQEALQQTTDWTMPIAAYKHSLGLELPDIRSGGGESLPIVTCKDGWIRIAIVALAEWRRMKEWLGNPEELADAELDALSLRVLSYQSVIRPYLMRLFEGMTMVEAAEEGQRRRIPITPLLRPSDVLEAEQYRELGTFVTGPIAPGLEGTVPSGYWEIDGRRAGFRSPTEYVPSLSECKWLSNERIENDPTEMGGLPYEGVRVLDLGVAGACPEMARLLAEYGADVIRVESPEHPDILRQLGQPVGLSAGFISSNRSKRSIGVDLSNEKGIEVVKDLVRHADVLLENGAPGGLARFGLAIDLLHRENPQLITLGSQMMGNRGPWCAWRGYGANTQPPSGLTYLWSYPGLEQPIGSNISFPDHVAGRLGALAMAACLVQRAPDRGQHVELVQAEIAVNLLGDLFLRESIEPGSVGPSGNESPEGAPWGVYECAGDQRWCVITCRDDRDWAHLVEALGKPRWATPDLDDVRERRARATEIDQHLTEWTKARTDREAMRRLQDHFVPAGVMLYPSDVVDDPHLRARGYVVAFEQPGFGPIVLEGGFFRSAALPKPLLFAAPRLGEHTRTIATEVLGRESGEVDLLIADGALFQTSDLSSEAPMGG
jgi:crotonobetainyl-CoA:carnitine CoA-transferase CaiB-like acyl-CoA transferase